VTRWSAFAGIALAVLVFLLILARLSQTVVTGSGAYVTREESRWLDRLPDGAGHLDAAEAPAPTRETPAESTLQSGAAPSTAALLANVALSHGLFAALLLGGIWLTDVPPGALGVAADPPSGAAVGGGIGRGVARSAANVAPTRSPAAP
jgi:hypothetical protein